MNIFRTLTAEEIECRIAQVVQPKKDNNGNLKGGGVSVLLYKTARTDVELLNETFGPEYWENDFKLIDGVLFGGLGIDYNQTGNRVDFIWKWDAGTESYTEAEKGRASDAFKRAGFKHGIGIELYSSPFIWIPATKLKKLDGAKCKDRFTVSSIGYSANRKINHLIITNQSGEIVFEMGEAPQDYSGPVCEDCGRPITDRKRKDGSTWPGTEIAEYTKIKFGRPLCSMCGSAAETALAVAESYGEA